MAAYLIGRDDDYLKALERAYRGYLDAREGTRASRVAFWIGLCLMFRAEGGQANGWLARARRLIDGVEAECAEQGYLLLPLVNQELDAGRCDAASESAARAAAIGDRCRDADLFVVARHLQGRARIRQGRVAEGLTLLDEAMVAVLRGTLLPWSLDWSIAA